jgi:hypothetical protein
MKQLPSPEEYAEDLISKMFSFIPLNENANSALVSAKFCAKQSVKENIELLNFINDSVFTPLTEYYTKVLEILDKRKFV